MRDPYSTTGDTGPQGATINAVNTVSTGVTGQLVLLVTTEIKETTELQAKRVRLVKQEPLVSLELLVKKGMLEGLVNLEQLDLQQVGQTS